MRSWPVARRSNGGKTWQSGGTRERERERESSAVKKK
jgi:hypothetical protein